MAKARRSVWYNRIRSNCRLPVWASAGRVAMERTSAPKTMAVTANRKAQNNPREPSQTLEPSNRSIAGRAGEAVFLLIFILWRSVFADGKNLRKGFFYQLYCMFCCKTLANGRLQREGSPKFQDLAPASPFPGNAYCRPLPGPAPRRGRAGGEEPFRQSRENACRCLCKAGFFHPATRGGACRGLKPKFVSNPPHMNPPAPFDGKKGWSHLNFSHGEEPMGFSGGGWSAI